MEEAVARAYGVMTALQAAVGRRPDIIEEPDHIRVEVRLPAVVSAELLGELLTAVTPADRYGHDFGQRFGPGGVLWAEFYE